MYIILSHLALAYVWTNLTSDLLFDVKLKLPTKFQWLFSKLYCFKCIALWLTLLLTMNIYTAVITSAIAIILDKYTNTYE